jgi:hypothetical protein
VARIVTDVTPTRFASEQATSYALARATLYQRSALCAAVVPELKIGTAEERAWLVWMALCGSNKEAPAELFRLRELFEASFPNEGSF